MKAADWMRLTIIGAMASIVGACASIGRPEGGPRDETPPEFVKSNPMPGSTNIDRNRIDIIFNENIKLEDVSNKLVVSPAQKQNPSINSNGRRVTIELRDSLKPNTTYTLDFSDAIRDLNEGNILDGFAMDFATGNTIDSLSVSGMVFEARTLEPAQGMVVGVYSNLSDTAVKTLPLERVAKTNQYGQFTIRNLKPGNYHIFAIDDRNHDWHWDRSENVAFADFTISPVVEEMAVTDTLRSQAGEDSIVTRQAWHYLPDDVLLTWFNENYKPQYLRDYERTDRRRVTFKFGAAMDSLPEIVVANGPLQGRRLRDLSVIEAREGLDSIVYWLRDTVLVNQDSLMVAAHYLKTDSLDELSMTTDTLKLFVKGLRRNKEKKKKNEDADTVAPPVTLLEFKALTSSQQELNLPVTFEAGQPVAEIDSLGWRLEIAVDTLWNRVDGVKLERDSANIRRFNLAVPWREGERYRFTADSLSVVSIYGEWIKDFKHEFSVKKSEDYGNISFSFPDIGEFPDSVDFIVELLGKNDQPVQVQKVADGEVTFRFVAPGAYYARAYVDANRNGQWDTGSLAGKIQPEEVYYYNKKLNLRKNWDIDQEWTLLALPVDEQKPNDIKKNKPKTRDKDRQRQSGDEDNEEGEFDDNYYDDQGAWGNGSQYNNAGRNSRRSSGGGGRLGLRNSRDRM